MNEPAWLTRADVERLHTKSIDLAGGAHGLRDSDLLESALARPRNLHAYGEDDRFQLAASYAEGLARNHAFVDGNKRTAFLAAGAFLLQNGHVLKAREDDGYVSMMERLAQGQVSREQMTQYLRSNERVRERNECAPEPPHPKNLETKLDRLPEVKPLVRRSRNRDRDIER